MTWPGLTQDFERLCSTCQVYQIIKKDQTSKKEGLLPPKIAEPDIVFLLNGICGSGGGFLPFAIRTPAKTHSLLALTMIDSAAQHRLV
jgi:hypothetical protein